MTIFSWADFAWAGTKRLRSIHCLSLHSSPTKLLKSTSVETAMHLNHAPTMNLDFGFFAT
eukprot:8952719-Pyramimonas_sp.AAC.1